MRTLIVYDSFTGNTEKVVSAVSEALKENGLEPEIIKAPDFKGIVEIKDVELLVVGSPVIHFLPSERLIKFCKRHVTEYLKRGYIIPKAPKIKGKFAIAFVTYGGMHTGIREAIPALKYIEQFLEHMRFQVVDEFYVVGEYHGKGFEEYNTETALGDITGRPNEEDLREVKNRIKSALEKIRLIRNLEPPKEEFIPSLISFFQKNSPDALKALNLYIEAAKRSALTEREGLLVLIAAAAAVGCEDCLRFHVNKALSSGITPEEIKSILTLILPVAGARAVNLGSKIIE